MKFYWQKPNNVLEPKVDLVLGGLDGVAAVDDVPSHLEMAKARLSLGFSLFASEVDVLRGEVAQR